jgi:PAS domain S-box-containing protein
VLNGNRSELFALLTTPFSRLTWRSVGLAAGVAATYFLVARVGLALVVKPEGVAVFWPAAGLSAGLVMILGRQAWLPIAIGVAAATIAANLLGDRKLLLALAFGLCNSGEAILTAWLAERRPDPDADHQNLRRVLRFMLAAMVGPAVAAMAAALTLKLTGHSSAPLPAIWLAWFAADAVGIVTVAPILISLATASHNEWPTLAQITEGAGALVVLTILSIVAFSVPLGPLATSLPDILLLPCLLWLAARSRPVFSTAGIAIVSVTVIALTHLGIGHYGDPGVPLGERVFAAQLSMLAYALAALSIAALFGDQQQAEVRLNQVNARLQLALDATEQGVWSVDLMTRQLLSDTRAKLIHGLHSDQPFVSLDQVRAEIHPDDLPRIDSEFETARQSGSFFELQYRIASPATRPEDVLWIAAAGRFDANRRQVHGVMRDITQRKQAQAAQAESEARLWSILQAANVVAWEVDLKSGHVHTLGPVAELLNKADGKIETQAEFLGCVATIDRDRVMAALQATIGGNGPYNTEFRVPLADGGMRWIGDAGALERDHEGQPSRMRGVSFDITKRKSAELALAEALRVTAVACEAGRMGTWHLDVAANRLDYSDDMLALMGIERSQWSGSPEALEEFIHPDDVEPRRTYRAKVLASGGDFDFEFRIHKPDGEVRWMHSRGRIIRAADGAPAEGFGVMVDVTERKHAEQRQKMLIAELDHRVKNTLASVGAVVQRTRDDGRTLDEFIETLDGRIYSMAHTHSLLSLSHWEGASLAALVNAELKPYANSSNHDAEGPETVLAADTAQVVATVLHELTTNASKYGALSTAAGHVSVRWEISTAPSQAGGQIGGQAGRAAEPPQMLTLNWVESGGPAVAEPDRHGYGTSVICDQIPYELKGRVDLSFAASGVRCRIELPLDRNT